jgi:hypothetical protein
MPENFPSCQFLRKPTNAFVYVSLKNSATRLSTSGFFYESVSPKPLNIPLGRFKCFRKFAEIFAAQGAPPVSLTPVANEKNLQPEKF